MIASTTTAGDAAAIFSTMLPILIVLILLATVFAGAVLADRRAESEAASRRNLLDEVRREANRQDLD